MIITDIQILSILLFEKPPKISKGTNWEGKRREVQQMSRKTRKLQFPHSSLLLEKIPQEREKYLRKWEGIEENEEEEKDELGESGDSGALYKPGEKYLKR